jgi:hypothetical protein
MVDRWFQLLPRGPTALRHEFMVEFDGLSGFPAAESGMPRDSGREPREARRWSLVWLAVLQNGLAFDVEGGTLV